MLVNCWHSNAGVARGAESFANLCVLIQELEQRSSRAPLLSVVDSEDEPVWEGSAVAAPSDGSANAVPDQATAASEEDWVFP